MLKIIFIKRGRKERGGISYTAPMYFQSVTLLWNFLWTQANTSTLIAHPKDRPRASLDFTQAFFYQAAGCLKLVVYDFHISLSWEWASSL